MELSLAGVYKQYSVSRVAGPPTDCSWVPAFGQMVCAYDRADDYFNTKVGNVIEHVGTKG